MRPRCILITLILLLLPLAILLVAGCGSRNRSAEPGGGPGGAPNAQWEIVRNLQEDLEAVRHPSDGGGRAWIEPSPGAPAEVTAGTPGRWTIVYEAGPLGIAEGGVLFLQVSPFWDWSTPQAMAPHAPGFTEVTTEAAGVALRPQTVDNHLLAIEVTGRALSPGERVRLVFGAGPAGAMADRYAERGSRFWIAVDGNGDGIRKNLPDSPAVTVRPGPPARLLLTLPTTARTGQTVRLTVALLDAAGNAGYPVEGEILLGVLPPGVAVSRRIRLEPGDQGRKTVTLVTGREGVVRLGAHGPGGLIAESNPMVVSPVLPRVLWGDLQIHSNYSDGTGIPEDLYDFARNVAALDVAAVTDHDHWGTPFLDQTPALWEEIVQQTGHAHEPGRFVTLLGYEWTNWIHGHRHVLFGSATGEVLSSLDPRHDTPQELWAGLRGRDAVTLAHHSAGGPVATNWNVAPDPALETVTEIVSVHGSSEAADSPFPVNGALAGNYVRDALDRGYRLGFVGSGDGHDGHPGLAHLGARTGGLAAILSEELTRPAVLEALRARRVYATSGPRILLAATLEDQPMGSVLPAPERPATLEVQVVAPRSVARVDLVRGGRVVDSVPGEGSRELSFERSLRDLTSGEYLYLRVVQEDGGLAWSSPFFIE